MDNNEINKIDSVTDEKKKPKKNKESEFQGVSIIDQPTRSLPKLVNELINKNFTIHLTKNGYYIPGFYGLNRCGDTGYAFFQETTDPELLAFYDAKGNKVPVRSFTDLVSFNANIWGYFYKTNEDYKKPDPQWFPYMMELNILNITPPSK